jgi:hypothetical protein
MTGQSTYSVKAAATSRACWITCFTILSCAHAEAFPQKQVAASRSFSTLKGTTVAGTGRQALVKRISAAEQRQTETVTTGVQAAAGLLMLTALLKKLSPRVTPVLVASRARHCKSPK